MGRIKDTRNVYIIFVQKSYKLTFTPRRTEAMIYVVVGTSVSLLVSLVFTDLGPGLLLPLCNQ